MTWIGRPPTPPHELDRLEAMIDGWLATQLAENEAVLAVERGEAGERRWYVRLAGEVKSVFSVWFVLGQRSLAYETYLLPAPEENQAAVYEYALRRNASLYGVAFTIGDEDALYLIGELPNERIDAVELDRVLGTVYLATEQFFTPVLHLAFASRFGTN